VAGRSDIAGMIRIAISPAAFDAIASTMPLGTVGLENARDANGNWLTWLPRHVVARLNDLRAHGEDYSDVILRVLEELGAGGERSRALPLKAPRRRGA
jgi:hypothetical protein